MSGERRRSMMGGKKVEVDYSTRYFTLKALQSGTFTFNGGEYYYSINGGTSWTRQRYGGSTPTVSAGTKVMFRSTRTPNSSSGIGTFTATCNFEAEGNIMSLLYGDNFEGQVDLTGKDYAFQNMFKGSTRLVSAKNLVLPATVLSRSCYYWMFQGCTSLVHPPKIIPATTMAMYSCYYMFGNCTSLLSAPELPATTMAELCYSCMFIECSSLTTAPTLPATTMAKQCYYLMFYNCTSLLSAPELPATTMAESCYQYMFYKCTSLATTPSLPATTLAKGCYNGMFMDCTSLTVSPSLPATTLADSCYQYMLGNTDLLPDCSNIDFTSQTVVASGGLKGLFGYTKVTDEDLAQILPINGNGRYYLPVTTLASNCYQYMFMNCTSLTTAPELPATILISNCYSYMFYGCTSLNYIKAMFTTTPSASYTSNWLNNVASTGTFVKNSAATWNVTDANGVPSGWTVETAAT